MVQFIDQNTIDILIKKNAKLIAFLEEHKHTHHYCDDCWYSCPKSEEGCCDKSQGDECNCGADEYNKMIDDLITECKYE